MFRPVAQFVRKTARKFPGRFVLWSWVHIAFCVGCTLCLCVRIWIWCRFSRVPSILGYIRPHNINRFESNISFIENAFSQICFFIVIYLMKKIYLLCNTVSYFFSNTIKMAQLYKRCLRRHREKRSGSYMTVSRKMFFFFIFITSHWS